MDCPGSPDDEVDHLCLSGALGLGAVGVLKGLKASTHWLAHDALKQFGAIPTNERVVRDGKVFTAAGVSSGIDMALTLVADAFGEAAAQRVQLLIEYDPHPPFDAGSPDKAPLLIVSAAREEFYRLSQKAEG